MKTSAPAVSWSTTMSQSRSSESSSTAPTSWRTAWASTASVGRRGELVEGRDRVAERAVGTACDQRERRVLRLDSLAVGDAPEQRDELGEPRPLEDERLAARPDGRDHLDEVGRAEDEEEVGRGLLDELEERVPGGVRQLMRLVEDVDLVAALDRLQDDALADLADVVDAALRGGVHLDDVERGAVRDRDARVARLVGRRRWPCRCRGSSAPWRGCAPSRSCPCRAGRRRDTPAAPGRARSRSGASARRLPARRPRRSPAAGTSDTTRSRRDSSRWGETTEMPGRAFRRRERHHRRYLRRVLGSGGAAAPERESLALLPSGPDAVRTLPVRGTRSSTRVRRPSPDEPSLGRRSAPHGADFGFREPLTPHLARPGRGSLASALARACPLSERPNGETRRMSPRRPLPWTRFGQHYAELPRGFLRARGHVRRAIPGNTSSSPERAA